MNYNASYIDELKTAAESLDLTLLKGKSLLITGGSGLILSSLVDIIGYANDYLNQNTTLYLAARTVEELTDRFGEYTKSHGLNMFITML